MNILEIDVVQLFWMLEYLLRFLVRKKIDAIARLNVNVGTISSQRSY